MALSRSEITQFQRTAEQYLENHRPPRSVRGELDFRARVQGQSVEIYKLCPGGRGRPGQINLNGVAKATYVKARRTWKLYAPDDSVQWRRFDPQREFRSLEDALKTIERDRDGRFYG